MTALNRLFSLTFLGLTLASACIDIPEVSQEPSTTPDAATSSDAGQDGGTNLADAGPTDVTRPSLTGLAPADGATKVATSTRVTLTFSEPMNEDSLRVDASPAVAWGSQTWASGNTQLALQPTTALAENTTYTLTIDGKDLAGNALDGTRVVTFTTTGPAPDTTPPSILGFTPNNAATGVERSAGITVLFSEPMDKASVEAAFAITSPAGFTAGTFTWSDSGTEVTFKPSSSFPYASDVAWRILTTAKDTAGNRLQSTTLNTFRILRLMTATLGFDPATSGSLSSPSYWRQSTFYNIEKLGDIEDAGASRLFLGFKLDALPEALTRITQATLKWHTSGFHGDPFGKLGQLLLESVFIGDKIALSTTDWSNPMAPNQYHAATLGSPINVSADVATSDGLFDVTKLVNRDWTERANQNKRSQFRLRFTTYTNSDKQEDSIYSSSDVDPSLAELEITYETP